MVERKYRPLLPKNDFRSDCNRIFGSDSPYLKANGILKNCSAKQFNHSIDLLYDALQTQRLKNEETVNREIAIIKHQTESHSKLLKETQEIQKELREKQEEIAELLYELPRQNQIELLDNLESIKYLFENTNTVLHRDHNR